MQFIISASVTRRHPPRGAGLLRASRRSNLLASEGGREIDSRLLACGREIDSRLLGFGRFLQRRGAANPSETTAEPADHGIISVLVVFKLNSSYIHAER